MESSRALSIGRGVLRVVLLGAIGITLFVAYGLIDNAWYKVLAVQGGSMEPTITAGDLIVVTRPPAQVEVGQVLTLQVDGAVVTHRVVEVKPDGRFITQGDANSTRDDFSANDVHIVGEYRFSLPLIGRIVEPIVTGAWATDADSIAASAVSGEWPASAVARAIDVGGRITWEPSPSATPSPSPAASATPESTAGPSAEPSETAAPRPTEPRTRPAPSPRSIEPVPVSSPTDDPTPTPTPTPSPTPSPASEPTETSEPSAVP